MGLAMNTLLRAALLLTTAGSVATSQAQRTVIGCVVDNVTKQPLPQVAVTVLGGSDTTVTDSLGFFALRGIRDVVDRHRFAHVVIPRDSIILVFQKNALYTSTWARVPLRARSPIPLVNVGLRRSSESLGFSRIAKADTAAAYVRTNRPRWEALHRACVAAVQKTAQGT